MNESWIYSTSTLLYGIFHLTALNLALVFWKRYPRVCVLVLSGSLLNLAALGARIALPMFWFQFFDDHGAFAFMNLGISLVNIAGSSLYLIAVFTGRSNDPPRRLYQMPREDDDWDRTIDLAPTPERGNTGIKE